MLDDILSYLECAFLLIAFQDHLISNRVVLFDHEHGDLRRIFGKFERAWYLLAERSAKIGLHDLHAMAEVATPAVAPAAPKQAKVARLG